MAEMIDYTKVKIKEGKPEKDFNYMERRAKILELIEEAGHPRMISQYELASVFGVTQSQIAHDFRVLREFIKTIVGREAPLISHTVYNKSIKQLMAEGRYVEACKVMGEWNNWLFNIGAVDKTPEKHQVEGGVQINIIRPEEAPKDESI